MPSGPVRAILAEYTRRTATAVDLQVLPAARSDRLVETGQADGDLVLGLGLAKQGQEHPVSRLPGATKVAWKHPTGEPVWGAVLSKQGAVTDLLRSLGGPTGHRLWSESPAGFTIVSGPVHSGTGRHGAMGRTPKGDCGTTIPGLIGRCR